MEQDVAGEFVPQPWQDHVVILTYESGVRKVRFFHAEASLWPFLSSQMQMEGTKDAIIDELGIEGHAITNIEVAPTSNDNEDLVSLGGLHEIPKYRG